MNSIQVGVIRINGGFTGQKSVTVGFEPKGLTTRCGMPGWPPQPTTFQTCLGFAWKDGQSLRYHMEVFYDSGGTTYGNQQGD